jgi:hypothetical protein
MLTMEGIITHGVALALILLALSLLIPGIKPFFLKRRIEKRITNLGVAQLRNFLLDDGVEGKVFIERLLLQPDGLLLLAGNRREGHIFGGERIDNWAQVVGKRTYKFANPLYALETALAALRYHAPGVSVTGKILFLGNCTFPKGQPESTLSLDDINTLAQQKSPAGIDAKLQKAWDVLAQRVEPAEAGELDTQESGTSGSRRWLASLLLLLATGWWLWRLCPI